MGASVSMRPFLITAAGQFEKQIQRPVAPYFLASALLPMAALSRSAVVPAFKMLRSAPTAAFTRQCGVPEVENTSTADRKHQLD